MPTSAELLVQYQALTAGTGVYLLSNWSCVSIDGADRSSFIQNFCTNDVQQLEPGHACEAFLTDVKGKTLGHVLVCCADQRLRLLTVPGQSHRIIDHLDRYLIREDVQLSDDSHETAFHLVTGPQQIADVLDQSGNSRDVFRMPVDFLGIAHAKVIETPVGAISAVTEALLSLGATRCLDEAFHAVRIEAGLPLYGIDFNESNLPQEIGRDSSAISFTKGCYLGQETVARIDALGHVNRLLKGIRFPQGDVPTTPLELTCEGDRVGELTSVTFSPQLDGPLGLAIIRREQCQEGCQLDSLAGPCQVVPLPTRQFVEG